MAKKKKAAKRKQAVKKPADPMAILKEPLRKLKARIKEELASPIEELGQPKKGSRKKTSDRSPSETNPANRKATKRKRNRGSASDDNE